MRRAANQIIVHVCGIPALYRLRLNGGGYVYMAWHNYCGPTLFRDRACSREIDGWWFDDELSASVDWFIKRGKRA